MINETKEEENLLEHLQNYTIENCIKDLREKFPAEHISKNDFEGFIKSRLRLFITSAYMLGRGTKK